MSSSGSSSSSSLFNPHSLELFSGWERWDWVDLGVFAGMVVFVAGVSVQLLESCGWDCLAYFVLVVSGIDEVVWLWRSKRSSSSSSSGSSSSSFSSSVINQHLRGRHGKGRDKGRAGGGGGGGGTLRRSLMLKRHQLHRQQQQQQQQRQQDEQQR
mmetsp:Transcript_21002/g.40709  ORF Transcript_21002/g.40709 Transcript_21002/m.40709 type:complete len:155 (+) Transcript_21002:252-716(+)